MRKKLVAVAAGLLSLAFAFAGCAQELPEGQTEGALALPYDDMINAEGEYDESLFYRNELETECADPGVIYVSEEESDEYGGWYYMYATTDYTGWARFYDCWRSKDLVNWENMTETTGVRAFEPSSDHYGFESLWAPEVVYDGEDGKFYMFYSCNVPGSEVQNYLNGRAVQTEEQWNSKHAMPLLGLAVSECPWGPFEPYDYDADDSAARSNVTGRSGEKSAAATPLFDNDKMMEQARKVFAEIQEARVESGYEYWYAEEIAGGATEEDAETRAEYMVSQEPYSYSDPDHGHAYFCDIDPSPYIAPDGTKYLLFNRNETGTVGTTTVWGMKMNEWWEPDYTSLRQLTETYYNTVDDVTPANRNSYEETHINEGPFLVDYTVDGKTYYSLTFSINNYAAKNYGVWQAINESEDPLGSYRKLAEEEGGRLLTAMEFTYLSGTGHHSFVSNGEEMFVVYHEHINPNGGGQRAAAADRVHIVQNNDGLPVLYVNGPTVGLQPKLDDTEYKNIAGEAEVSVSAGENTGALTDGLFTVYRFIDYVKEYQTQERAVITLKFAEPREVTGIMFYNSRYFENTFFNIARIEFDFTDTEQNYSGTAYIENLAFDWDRYCPPGTESMRSGGSAVAAFSPLMVSEIRITVDPKTSRVFEEGQTTGELDRLVLADDEGYVIDGVETLSIAEIVVLGK